MTKSIKFWAVSLAALCAIQEARACWEPWYAPSEYYMYRVYESQPDTQPSVTGADENCVAWQRLTSPRIPVDDIYRAVYKMTLEEIESIYAHPERSYDNRFIEWITKRDRAALDFLLLAKTNEYIRLKRNSRWYYPSMKTGTRMTLEEVAGKALSVKDKRLRDRYLLQGMRALFSLGEYEACIDLWESEAGRLPHDNLMRRLMQPYYQGAMVRMKRADKAIEYFAQIGDIESMLFCIGREGEPLSTVDALSLVCEYAPNSDYIAQTLQSYVRKLEVPIDTRYCDSAERSAERRADSDKLYALCMKMGRNPQTENPALWYYTAAFLSSLNGQTAEASRVLRLAERARSTDYIDESIAVFRIYLDARLLPYNQAYEKRLFRQLEWLDGRIVAQMNDSVRNETARGYKLMSCKSFYYWNDMMRRIVLAEICPRMIEAGKTTRALQLANMADNRLLGLVDRQVLYSTETDSEGNCLFKQSVVPMQQYRYSGEFNSYDYSNHFFEMIDSLGADAAIRYVRQVEKPASRFDRFLNARGYTGSDYLNDIAGTQCLRHMRYGEATEYLGAVNEAYKHHLNVESKYDPFAIKQQRSEHPDDFKFAFAREMLSLEQSIKTTREPNRKARLMVRYAIGLRNSFDRCWSLTQYYRGESYWGQVCPKRDWEHDPYTRAARRKVESTINEAVALITDDETRADIEYELCNFSTVAHRYPNTEKGRLVRGRCDNLADYHADRFSYR